LSDNHNLCKLDNRNLPDNLYLQDNRNLFLRDNHNLCKLDNRNLPDNLCPQDNRNLFLRDNLNPPASHS